MIGGVPGGDAEGVVRLSAALVVICNATSVGHGAALVRRDAALASLRAHKEVHGDTEGCLFAGDEEVRRWTRLMRSQAAGDAKSTNG